MRAPVSAVRMLIGSLILVLGTGLAQSAEITGAWESNQGPMIIAQNADGTYAVTFELIQGMTTGALKGDVLKGDWVRKKEDLAERCKTEKDGSPFWGGFRITFYEGIGFQGYWHFCGDEVKVMNWTGARPKQ